MCYLHCILFSGPKKFEYSASTTYQDLWCESFASILGLFLPIYQVSFLKKTERQEETNTETKTPDTDRNRDRDTNTHRHIDTSSNHQSFFSLCTSKCQVFWSKKKKTIVYFEMSSLCEVKERKKNLRTSKCQVFLKMSSLSEAKERKKALVITTVTPTHWHAQPDAQPDTQTPPPTHVVTGTHTHT